jgi:HK97 family phage prohead protease
VAVKTSDSIVKTSGFLSLKFAASDAKQGIFEGYGAVFGNVDQGGDLIRPGAFRQSLADHKAEGILPPMLWQHRQDQPIGRWLEIREDDVGLFMRGQCNLATTAGKDAHAHIVEGDVSGMSIGYLIPPNGSKFDERTGVTILEAIELREVSVVTLPMNRLARITSKRELETILAKSGLSRGAAEKIASGGWPALLGDEPPETPDELVKAVSAFLHRSTSRIRTL